MQKQVTIWYTEHDWAILRLYIKYICACVHTNMLMIFISGELGLGWKPNLYLNNTSSELS